MNYHELLKNEGLVLLKNILSSSEVDLLRKKAVDSMKYLNLTNPDSLYKISSYLASPSHIGFLCPMDSFFCSKKILLNKNVVEILDYYLGSDYYLHEYVDNVALSDSDTYQRPHPDQEYDNRGPCGIVCNVVLENTNAENGSTVLWKCTHDKFVTLDTDSLNNQYEKKQLDLESGDIVLRDISLVHCGAPNKTNRDRHMLALVFKPERQPISEHMVQYCHKDLKKNKKLFSIMRKHKFVDSQVILPKCYPNPKMSFGEGYEI